MIYSRERPRVIINIYFSLSPGWRRGRIEITRTLNPTGRTGIQPPCWHQKKKILLNSSSAHTGHKEEEEFPSSSSSSFTCLPCPSYIFRAALRCAMFTVWTATKALAPLFLLEVALYQNKNCRPAEGGGGGRVSLLPCAL